MKSSPVPRARRSVLDELFDLAEASGLRVTFDAERDCTAPCWICKDASEPYRRLVLLGHYISGHRDPMSRPVCKSCLVALPAELQPATPAEGCP
jgi:hypothetical protein